MIDYLAQQLEGISQLAPVWGFVLIFVFMTIESSFIPFPSEIVMIPAGFLAFRGELTTGIIWIDLLVAFCCGLSGSVLGAYINYWLAIKLGRPFLHNYGKYFFIKEDVLNRAEEIFRNYGDITTFVCRLIPVVRQIISIPAGLSKMPFGRFSFFTGLGAGIWVFILLGVGAYFGHLSGDMSYFDMVTKGKEMIHENSIWLILGLAIVIIAYSFMHKKIMGTKTVKA